MNKKWLWLAVVSFAAAMAWVESSVVFYLRTMVDRIEPYQAFPLPVFGGLGLAELVRELATMIMLAIVGILAGKNFKSRFGCFLLAFGAWDIFYYVFLKILTGWPHNIGDWDILFLIPLPWWGPVWAPMAIALLMIFWGTLATQNDVLELPGWRICAINVLGGVIALYAFMEDAIQVSFAGGNLRHMLPASFNWPLFMVGLGLMSLPVLIAASQSWKKSVIFEPAPLEERS
ncbi:MAG: hypothetical protein ABIQ35_01805 [Verrucomicrobiota bacterium]